MTGIISNDRKQTLCFRGSYLTAISSWELLTRVINTTGDDFWEIEPIENLISVFKNESKYPDAILSGFVFNVSRRQETKPFDLPLHLDGVFNFNNRLLASLSGMRFNMDKFVTEGKKFGLGIAVGIVMHFYAWFLIHRVYNAPSQLEKISSHSLMMHAAYDWAFSCIILDIIMLTPYNAVLYFTLCMSLWCIYYGMQVFVLVKVWKGRVSEDTNVWCETGKFWMELVFVMCVASWASVEVYTSPVPNLIFLYSFWIPQIIHQAKSPFKDKKLIGFYVPVSLFRGYILAYFTLYKANIMQKHDIRVGVCFVLYLAIQTGILVSQCVWGGDWFLPKSMRPRGFDYETRRPSDFTMCPICMGTIEAEEPVMTSPCSHAFHRDCLRQWMEIDRICPVCRAALPAEQEPQQRQRIVS